jgi:hypothetical protein
MSRLFLRRYCDLTALIYLLTERAITLLDPVSWDDSNDSHYAALYKEKKELEAVLALCFTETDERYHYWRVSASGASGVCITKAVSYSGRRQSPNTTVFRSFRRTRLSRW